jgi:hypothetical protein
MVCTIWQVSRREERFCSDTPSKSADDIPFKTCILRPTSIPPDRNELIVRYFCIKPVLPDDLDQLPPREMLFTDILTTESRVEVCNKAQIVGNYITD